MVIAIRTLTQEDLDDIVRVEEETWEPELRASRETFVDRLKRFPQGFLGCYVDGRLAGMTYVHPITTVKNTWYDNSSAEAFNPEGKIFYIVNVGVSKHYQGQGIGSRLLDENKRLARELSMKKLVLGARNTENNSRFYSKNGFIVADRIEGYWPEDKASNGVGVVMEFYL